MTPVFSDTSRQKLATCHEDLVSVCEWAIECYDFAVIEGHRGKEKQNRMVEEGKSHLAWPESEHNSEPSRAVDIAPWPIAWSQRDRFYALAGVMHAASRSLGIALRWGGAWNRNRKLPEQQFDDLGHYEIHHGEAGLFDNP